MPLLYYINRLDFSSECSKCTNSNHVYFLLALPQSPLHLAVLTRQHKVIQYLLKANANPLVCDRDGNTPLHLACK